MYHVPGPGNVFRLPIDDGIDTSIRYANHKGSWVRSHMVGRHLRDFGRNRFGYPPHSVLIYSQ